LLAPIRRTLLGSGGHEIDLSAPASRAHEASAPIGNGYFDVDSDKAGDRGATGAATRQAKLQLPRASVVREA
jgi:hypothetical protein